MDAKYSVIVESVKAAINAGKTAESKWDIVGKNILAFYDSPEALKAVKAQFCADAIIPVLDKRHRDALAVNVKDTDAKSPEGIAVRAAKKDATATRDTMFMHALRKAWPEYGKKDDDDGDDKPDATDSDKLRKALAELVTRIQKKEGLDFDAAAVVGFLNKAVAAAAPKN